MRKLWVTLSVTLIVFVLMSRSVLACSTCMADPASTTASALNSAILLLLALIAGIFLLIAGCIWKLSRRIKAMENRGEIL